MDALILRIQGPLMSFGAPAVDNHRVIQRFPTASMLTGLIGNALGYNHADWKYLQRLQERIRFAARIDRPGREIVDFQTVDLGQDHLVDTGWTTYGYREARAGGSGGTTHIRYQHYLADASITVALSLEPPRESPSLDEVEAALQQPERPLFLGRKSCLPAEPVFLSRSSGQSLITILRSVKPSGSLRVEAQWPRGEEALPKSLLVGVTDERDWRNQIHCGERLVRRGVIELGGGESNG